MTSCALWSSPTSSKSIAINQAMRNTFSNDFRTGEVSMYFSGTARFELQLIDKSLTPSFRKCVLTRCFDRKTKYARYVAFTNSTGSGSTLNARDQLESGQSDG